MPQQSPRFKLQLSKLDFLSLVDEPAQQTAKIRLIKRKGSTSEHDVAITARIVKVGDGSDPLLYCWAFTTHDGGQPYHDLQGDAISEGWQRAAEEFIKQGGAVDEMHDGEQKSRIAFAFPMDGDIATALLGAEAGAAVKTAGLMVAIRPTAEQLAKVRSGEFTGVSIAGTGVRELMKRRPSRTAKSVWTTADIDALPDSSFLYVEPGGKKDTDGKTTPRSLRHFPYRDAAGKVDLDHLRNAISRIPQSSLAKDLRDKLQVKAEKLLAAQHDTSKRLRKQAVLTSTVDGHAHSIDLDDPADEWRDQLSTSYQTSEGATQSHCHAWTFDPETGKITIADDSGHTHDTTAVVPDDVRAQAAENEDGERCRSCGAMCDEDDRYCPSCGKPMGGGVPSEAADDDDSGPTVIAISMRADVCADCGETMGAGATKCASCGKTAKRKSPPSGASRTVKGNQEPSQMPEDNARIRELEAANARLEKMSTLTDAQRAHFAKLKTRGLESEAASFLALTPAQRNTALDEITKADAEVYTSKSTGKVYRQSDALEIIEAAKQTDAMAELQKRLETERSELEFSKRAEAVLPNFAKGVKGNLRARLLKAVSKEFTDAAEHAEVEKALKSADFALKETLSSAKGVNPHIDPTAEPQTVQAKLDALAANYAKTNNVPLRKAAAAVLETAEGAELYAQLPVGRA